MSSYESASRPLDDAAPQPLQAPDSRASSYCLFWSRPFESSGRDVAPNDGFICRQGFNVVVDDLGGWGSATAQLLGEVQDDYAGTPLLLWAARQHSPRPAATADVCASLFLHPNCRVCT